MHKKLNEIEFEIRADNVRHDLAIAYATAKFTYALEHDKVTRELSPFESPNSEFGILRDEISTLFDFYQKALDHLNLYDSDLVYEDPFYSHNHG